MTDFTAGVTGGAAIPCCRAGRQKGRHDNGYQSSVGDEQFYRQRKGTSIVVEGDNKTTSRVTYISISCSLCRIFMYIFRRTLELYRSHHHHLRPTSERTTEWRRRRSFRFDSFHVVFLVTKSQKGQSHRSLDKTS